MIGMAVADLRREAQEGDLGRDVAIVGTISAAHFCSHFYQFTIPLLFPRIQAEYGVGFTELGLIVTVFYASSGFAQTAAGFLVDHVGPSRVLTAGLGLLAASMALVALVPSFWLIYPAAALGGGLVFLLVLAKQRLLAGPDTAAVPSAPTSGHAPSPLAALRHPAVLVCFSFFFLMAVPTVGLSGFVTTALGRLYETPIATVAAALTANLVGSALGVLLGGILADRFSHHERIVAASVFFAAAIYFAVGLLGFGPLMLAALLGAAGFTSGLAAP